MREELKTYLAEYNISEEEYNGGSLEDKARLVLAFEKSKSQGEGFIHCVFSLVLLIYNFLVILDDFNAVIFLCDFHFVSSFSFSDDVSSVFLGHLQFQQPVRVPTGLSVSRFEAEFNLTDGGGSAGNELFYG